MTNPRPAHDSGGKRGSKTDMAIEYKDYYAILGLSHDAGEEEVRTAFRRLARIYHPDKTGNDREAEDRFKEINEAYEVLGDGARRKRYDEFLSAWESNANGQDAWRNFSRAGNSGEGFARAGSRQHYRFDGAGFSEFFDELFGSRDRAPKARAPHRTTASNGSTDQCGDDLESDLWVTLNEVATGAVRPITMKRAMKCGTCYGMGQYNAHPCEACGGSGSLLHTDTYKVRIPKGIAEDSFLRIPGRGEQGLAHYPAGDLYLKVHYSAHPDFRVENGLLVHDLELAPWEAVLGSTVTIPTLDGKTTIRIPAGTQSGRKLRVRGKGLPGNSSAGDLLVNVIVQVPNSAALRERQLWEELARESTFHPRGN